MAKTKRNPEYQKKPVKLWNHQEREKALETAEKAKTLPHLQNQKIKYLLKN